MKKLTLLGAATLMAGCGTYQSIQEDEALVKDMQARGTHCASLPRIYSGTFYNFCILNAERPNPKKFNPGGDLIWLDWIASGVADTVLLPYGAYKQFDAGNVDF